MTIVSSAMLMKALRFAFVGGLNSLAYAAVTGLCAHGGINPTIASIVGYSAVLPFAFVAHKRFTFRANGEAKTEATRFVVVNLCGLLVSVSAMYIATNVFGWHYLIGIVAAIALVPIITLIISDRWVFTNQKEPKLREYE